MISNKWDLYLSKGRFFDEITTDCVSCFAYSKKGFQKADNPEK